MRIEKRISISNYPPILELLAKYMEGKDTHNEDKKKEENDSAFEYLQILLPAQLSKEELDDYLIEEIFNQYKKKQEVVFFVQHKHLEAFLFSDEFEISTKPGTRFEPFGQKPPSIEKIIVKINASDMDDFKEKFKRSKLRFLAKDGEKTADPVISFIEGELSVNGISYFKIRNMWYELKSDYFAVLHEDFKAVIKNALIKKNSEGWLPELWRGSVESDTARDSEKQDKKPRKKDEEVYNRTYMKTPYGAENGYLVFDQVLPENIEPCDILKYTDDTVYLYHVKENFGVPTRVVCSQMLNAARVIRRSLSTSQPQNYLQRLWITATRPPQKSKKPSQYKEDVRAQMRYFRDETEFVNIFRGDRKIVFVYAYVPEADKSFLHEMEKFRVTSDCLTVPKGKDKEKLFQMLIKLNYLDSCGRLTGKFVFGTQKSFKLEGEFKRNSGAVFKQLCKYRPCSKSTLAKIEIVHLAKNLRDLNFEFKICEIVREN
jgi:hypothetical protein